MHSKPSTEKCILPNGLTVIHEHLPAAQSAAIGFFVATGARDETAKESGVSHFLEHMMFKGTKTRSAMDITLELGNLGAQANAFTSEENTVYYSAIIPEKFDLLQELLSDMLRPALDPAEFDTEKKVIIEEIALYQDRPSFYLLENSMLDFYQGHPAGNSVLGTTASLTAMTYQDMRAYFQRRYSPSNIVLVATGNFDKRRFLSAAEKLTASWERFDTKRDVRPGPVHATYKEFKRKNLTQTHLLFLTEGASAQSPDRFAVSLLAMLLGDSSGSRLYWELIDKGLAEDAGADNDERDGTGLFMAYASVEPKRADEVSKIVRKVLGSPLEFSDADLERAKHKLISKVVLSGELPMGRLMALGLEWNYRQRLHSLQETLESIRVLTRNDISKALRRYPLNTWAEYRLLPE